MTESTSVDTPESAPRSCVYPRLPAHVAGVPLVVITVDGDPRPGGSKTAIPLRRAGGALVTVKTPSGLPRPVLRYADDAKGNAGWKKAVRSAAALAWSRPPLQGPLYVEAEFRLRRPKGHFGARGLRPAAPSDHVVKPDLTKLWRSTEDALTGHRDRGGRADRDENGLWGDDAQVIGQILIKRYAEGLEVPGVCIRVYRAGTPWTGGRPC